MSTQFKTTTAAGTAPPHLFRPPGPNRASRNVRVRSRSTSCSTLVVGDTPREMPCESDLERKAALAFMARPDVVDVREQPPAVPYRDEAGVRREHTFDLLVTLTTGRRILFEVKPAKIAERKNLRAKMELIAGQVPRHVADEVNIVTDRKLGRAVTHDAELVHYARGCVDPEADAAVAGIVDGLNGSVTVETLVKASGLGASAFAAVVRLIASGRLRVMGRPRIGYDTLVGPAEALRGRAA
ncbi:Tn7 transposase TnsA N-terminal domain-containing protein [Methylobacterium organophilum]|uniref:Tn7 transposase TnsA N-terminal domain-containing protein n=1 Tax=Methylobacterium organophilum TaxID=410 RepID=UPI001F13F97B|nr:Tn7 transposase TnsA N-terminal domain-containing protein [Methylobacterium organophilum]UMY17115.1 Tn7 transposase TnsA N-terminal domain-containing protein [Methylobacterium organophilum]